MRTAAELALLELAERVASLRAKESRQRCPNRYAEREWLLTCAQLSAAEDELIAAARSLGRAHKRA